METIGGRAIIPREVVVVALTNALSLKRHRLPDGHEPPVK
jgi:hypothetical protein